MTKMYRRTSFNGQLRIKNRTTLQWLTVILAFWPVLINLVSSLPGPLSYLKYTPDGILVFMLILCLSKEKIAVRRDLVSFFWVVIGFFSYCLAVYLFQYQSAAYFLWGFRNNFRFYIAFFAFVAYLRERDITVWFKTMDLLFWINAGLSVLQFFVMGIKGDFLGGIFGIQGASNAYTLCLLSIVVGKSLLEAFSGKERFSQSILKSVVSVFVAAMAEMKFYYFVYIFLLVGSVMLTRFSVKKMIYLLLAMSAVMAGAVLLVEWFDFQGFFSLQGLLELATRENYATQRDLNRLSAIPTLCRRIVTNPLQQFFGLGLGNCDTSSFAVCNTPFYQKYSYLHYNWFSATMIFLETGFIGLGIYCSFFAACFFKAYRWFKAKRGNMLYNQLCILVSVLCLVLTAYDSSLRIEIGYMMYFVLALPIIGKNKGVGK